MHGQCGTMWQTQARTHGKSDDPCGEAFAEWAVAGGVAEAHMPEEFGYHIKGLTVRKMLWGLNLCPVWLPAPVLVSAAGSLAGFKDTC